MNKELIQTEGGVCAAKGFKATGLVVGIKKLDSTKKDMAMIYSDVVCKAAGTCLLYTSPSPRDRG